MITRGQTLWTKGGERVRVIALTARTFTTAGNGKVRVWFTKDIGKKVFLNGVGTL